MALKEIDATKLLFMFKMSLVDKNTFILWNYNRDQTNECRFFNIAWSRKQTEKVSNCLNFSTPEWKTGLVCIKFKPIRKAFVQWKLYFGMAVVGTQEIGLSDCQQINCRKGYNFKIRSYCWDIIDFMEPICPFCRFGFYGYYTQWAVFKSIWIPCIIYMWLWYKSGIPKRISIVQKKF